MDILDLLTKIMTKGTKKKGESKRSVVKDLIDDPDGFVLTAQTEGEEIKITLTRKNKVVKEEVKTIKETKERKTNIMNEFENKNYEGIYYSRFIASWFEAGGKANSKMKLWLKTLTINEKPIPDEVIKEIYNLATNGKLELESSAKRYLKGDK